MHSLPQGPEMAMKILCYNLHTIGTTTNIANTAILVYDRRRHLENRSNMYSQSESSYDDHNPAVILQGYDKTCAMKTLLPQPPPSVNVREMFLEIVHGQNGFPVQPNNL